MALLIWGVADRNDLLRHAFDRRRRLGKFMERVRSMFQGLIIEGTHTSDLRDLVGETFAATFEWEYHPSKGSPVADFATAHLVKNRPVILGLRGQKVAHAVVAIGYESAQQGDRQAPPRRFLLLDPAGREAFSSPWNASVRPSSGGSRWPYRFAGGLDGVEVGVDFDTALALWPKT